MAKSKADRKRILTGVISAVICIGIVIICFGISGNDFEDLKSFFYNDFDETQDFVRIIDVGQGDCALIYSDGYSALIDTGTAESASNVCSMLDECDIKSIDAVIISHTHTDHIGGIKQITEHFEIENLILPELSVESEGLEFAQLAVNKVTESGGEVYTAAQGMNFTVGEFEVTVLAEYSGMSDENDCSVIAVAEIEEKKFLFTGDAGVKTENALIKDGLDLKCDVLKVGHHGSATSSSEAFLKKVSPRYTVISVGRNNLYGHPQSEVLSRIKYVGAKIYRTDENGNITFNIENGEIKPQTGN